LALKKYPAVLFFSINYFAGRCKQENWLSMKARRLTEAHVQHRLLRDCFRRNSLSGSVECNAEAVVCPVAVDSFNSSEEHTVIDEGSDICCAIAAENGNTMVFTYHWSE